MRGRYFSTILTPVVFVSASADRRLSGFGFTAQLWHWVRGRSTLWLADWCDWKSPRTRPLERGRYAANTFS
jgi:hypothetical protein